MDKHIVSSQLYSWWVGQQVFLIACIAGFFQNLSAFLGYFCVLATNMNGMWLRRPWC